METLFINPIISGIEEHLLRIKNFVRNAKRAKKKESKFRNLIAAVYPARAVSELMFECADKKLINKSRTELKEWFEKVISFFLLIEKIRRHDFHRFGCLPPASKYKTLFIGGPIKLKASSGFAGMQISSEGKEIIISNKSSVDEQRSLYGNDGLFYDESSNRYLTLDFIVEEYTKSIQDVVKNFKNLIIN